MKKKNKDKLKTIAKSSEKERLERIANGTWMGRGTVFQSKKTYDRKKNKKGVRDEETFL